MMPLILLLAEDQLYPDEYEVEYKVSVKSNSRAQVHSHKDS